VRVLDLAAFHLACWANAWLAGGAAVDDVADTLSADGRAHHAYAADTEALIALDSPDMEPMLWVLTALRRAGTDLFVAALPVPGQLIGLAGPPGFNVDAVAAGSAAIACGSGLSLLPSVVGAGVQWQVRAAHAPPPVDVGEAEQPLAELMLSLSNTRPGNSWAGPAGDVPSPADLRSELARLQLPPTLGPRARRLAERAVQCWAVAESALATPALHSFSGSAEASPAVGGRVSTYDLRALVVAARSALSAVAASARQLA
jgi:hypothetical protein